MKTPALFFAVLLLGMLFVSCGTVAPITAEQKIDLVFSDYALKNGPGAALLVLHNDSILVKKSYGLADVEKKIPVTTTTNFRLASITKQFTAMTVLQLAEQKRLSLEDKIMKFFPDFPLYGKDITVRNLLQHTSGLVDYESLVPDSQTVQVLDADCLRLMFAVDSLYFAPGTQYQYSNTGYALLALITEKVSGIRFADFLKENIFSAVGMSSSVALEHGRSDAAHRAYGHSLVDGKWIQSDQSNTSAVLGDGGIYSNVEEIAAWISALWNYRLLPETSQQRSWEDGTLNDGTPIDYGMGWHKRTYRSIRHPHHGGSTRGFRNHILVFPEQKLMVIVLTNRNQGEPISLAQSVADLYLHP